MTQRPSKPVNPKPRQDGTNPRSAAPGPERTSDLGAGGDKVDLAFDLWLKRGLHQIYDDVAREPIPEELLRLIQEDKKK